MSINEPADQIMFLDTTISHINIVTAVINPLTTVLHINPKAPANKMQKTQQKTSALTQ